MLTADAPYIPRISSISPDAYIYPNCMIHMDCSVSEQPSFKESLLASGLDKTTVDAYLNIVESYIQAINEAESDYRKVVMNCTTPQEPSGRAEHHIISAYYKRIGDYTKAEEAMQEQIHQLSEQSGYPIGPCDNR